MKVDSIPTFIQSLDNLGVHNFSLGCLCSYFYLNENITSSKIKIVGDGAIFLPSPKPKTFVFTEPDDISELKPYQKLGPVYSTDKITLPLQQEFKEVEYDLDKVFDDATYPNTDKRKKAIRAPFKKLRDWLVTSEDLSEANFDEAKEVHDQWVDYKLNQPTTFRMMFSSARYLRCCKLCIEKPERGRGLLNLVSKVQPVYVGKLYRIDGKPAAVFVSSIQNKKAYSLAGFSLSWDLPGQFTHHVNLDFMKQLHLSGIKTINDGASLNKGLSMYKHHFPYEMKISYMYSKEKS